ncbi:hypothetical protein VTK73DRAFT_2697 [Phialemonium thermophilum]|uniref:Secreted protein n=1 Tax=Phialemonium thermophilum TaxID=223376 RepID=A0ABR3X3L1_9PEZI
MMRIILIAAVLSSLSSRYFFLRLSMLACLETNVRRFIYNPQLSTTHNIVSEVEKAEEHSQLYCWKGRTQNLSPTGHRLIRSDSVK